MAKPLVYFLCTGNSCRSQMAEGWGRHLGGDLWDVASAGISPTHLHPQAVTAMAEAGVDISGQSSKPVDAETVARAAVVVTLCGDAADRCPVVPRGTIQMHWPLPDPARAQGSPEEIAEAFRRVRDEIAERVRALRAEWERRPRA